MSEPHRLAESRLASLLAEIRACRLCVEAPRGAPLPHAPRPIVRGQASARIAVCGQAPGTRVHASGLPFTDPSGVRLRRWMGIGEAEFYDDTRVAVIPMGFCFPGLTADGSDLPPRPECAPRWRARVFAALPNLQLILLIGRHAQTWHLGSKDPGTLERAVAGWRADLAGHPAMIALPHPSWRNNAWLKRNAWFEAEVVPELQRRVRNALDEDQSFDAAAISLAMPEKS